MMPTMLGTLTIPGSELNAISTRVGSAFGISTSDAADFVSKVLEAYPDAVTAAGGPYVKASASAEKIVGSIASATGVSPGRIRQTLNEMAYLVSTGKISLSTYNPAKYSIAAKAKAAVKSGASAVKKTVKAVTPDAVEDVASGLSKGLSGMGDVLQLLPIVAVVGLGVWAYKASKS